LNIFAIFIHQKILFDWKSKEDEIAEEYGGMAHVRNSFIARREWTTLN
jgi:hypothetical protein